MLPLLAALLAAAPVAGHEATNPLYRDLLAAGVGGVPLPAATLPDGLPAAEQRKRIEAVVGADYAWGEFTRPSAVAPSLLRLRDVPGGAPGAPLKGLDLWFALHGSLDATDDPKFLDRVLTVGRQGGAGKELTADDLRKRDIPAPEAGGGREQFGRVEFDILDRVRLAATGRVVWSRTPESVVAAAVIDPRFADDAEFPNQWRPLSRGATGEPKPYRVAGFTLKVTKLAEPAGALFAEQHVVFEEPAGWFDGANLLRSKLPPVIQGQVRSMRREWAKGK